MWKGLLVYWLALVGGAAVFLNRGSRWPPDVDLIGPLSVVAVLAGVFVGVCVGVLVGVLVGARVGVGVSATKLAAKSKMSTVPQPVARS